MKRIIVSAAAAAVLAGGLAVMVTAVNSFSSPAWGQAARNNTAPHKIGLIDMAHVFKEYKKFDILRQDLKAEISKSDSEIKRRAEGIKAAQVQIKQLKEGSPDYERLERKILQDTSGLEAFRKGAQRDFLRKESQIYKTVYLEVSEAVKKYSSYYNYTLIIRFSRQNLDQGDSPGEVIQKMNQLVVDFRKEDDITDPVLDFLNRKYQPKPGPVSNRGGARKN